MMVIWGAAGELTSELFYLRKVIIILPEQQQDYKKRGNLRLIHLHKYVRSNDPYFCRR